MTVSNFTTGDLLKPPSIINDHYMLLPIEVGFGWQQCFADVENGDWYLVVFRSKHHAEADQDFLNWLDQKATEGAQQTPGFLYYFTGTPLATGECLSFCLWRDQQSALQGASHMFHRVAKDLGLMNYEYYCLERYVIHKKRSRLSFTPVGVTLPSEVGTRSNSV